MFTLGQYRFYIGYPYCCLFYITRLRRRVLGQCSEICGVNQGFVSKEERVGASLLSELLSKKTQISEMKKIKFNLINFNPRQRTACSPELTLQSKGNPRRFRLPRAGKPTRLEWGTSLLQMKEEIVLPVGGNQMTIVSAPRAGYIFTKGESSLSGGEAKASRQSWRIKGRCKSQHSGGTLRGPRKGDNLAFQ